MILCKEFGIPQCVYTLSVPQCGAYWPEDGVIETETCSQQN